MLFYRIAAWVFAMALTPKALSTFTGGVVEHNTFFGHSNESIDSLVSTNLKAYERSIEVAALNGVQILVFPEFGLTPVDNTNRELVGEIAEKIPDEIGTTPCGSSEFADRPILSRMSCAAKKFGVAVLVNMVDWVDCLSSEDSACPADAHYLFNTDVVFDEIGQIAAKYHKSHEWPGFKPAYNQPSQPSEVIFHASFGVDFGLFICFDIMFPDPAKSLLSRGIRHFLYAVAQGEVGEATIISEWSARNSATLLSANLPLHPHIAHDCSGILVNGTSLAARKVYIGDAFPKENILIANIE